jgi:hypothetical protein
VRPVQAPSAIVRVALSTLAVPLSSYIYSSGGKVRAALPAEKLGILETAAGLGGAGPRHLWLGASDG